MLAALLLNLGAGPPPPPSLSPRFGGGPFWKRYGYGKDYDEYLESLEAADPEITEQFEKIAEAAAQEIVIADPRIDSRELEQRVGERVAAAMSEIVREQRQAREEEELMAILMLL